MKKHGVCFSPAINGWDNVYGSQIGKLLDIVNPYFNWIRTFTSSGNNIWTAGMAKQLGFKLMAGAWVDSDYVSVTNEIDQLYFDVKNGYADIAVIGGECLNPDNEQHVEEAELIRLINQFGIRIQNLVPVTTNDTYDQLLLHPKVVAACDIIVANFYPFWEGKWVGEAASYMMKCINKLRVAYPLKQIIVGETGWPSRGSKCGLAVPSVANSARYFKEATTALDKEGIPCFYFETFDEAWKPNGNERSFGIWDGKMKMKTGFAGAFK